ncbi:MAG: hypothetical protein AAF741_10925 [Bacteroidota bacterium]
MQAPAEYYQDRKKTFEALHISLKRKYDRLALLRLVLFLIIIAGIIVIWSYSIGLAIGAIILLLPLLNWAIGKHREIFRAAETARRRVELAEAELRALDHDFSSWAEGNDYLLEDHPYTGDLDIFGQNSIFKFLNRTVTRLGSDRLASQLNGPMATYVIISRQNTIEVLSKEPDWCHTFRARGMETEEKEGSVKELLEWVKLPLLLGGEKPDMGAKLVMYLAPVLTALFVYLLVIGQPVLLALICLLPAGYYLRKYKSKSNRIHEQTALSGDTLNRYRGLIELIENRKGESSYWQELYAKLGHDGEASKAIGRLSHAINRLDVRYNALSILLEIAALYSLHYQLLLDQWRANYRDALPEWIDTLAEVDALMSWANLRYNQSEWTWPEPTSDARISAHELGHPLIDPRQRVANNFECATDGHIHLVTGSNMAGKSTWLRTVGINLVLAQAGGPVCAKHFQFPPLQVWTSMRTQDALSDNTSSFFAELKRLKRIINAVESPLKSPRRGEAVGPPPSGELEGDPTVFFLLDEILKGTNSRDRHTGARALIRQLIRAEGAGIIATHDLELAEMEKEPGSEVENYAMEVDIVDGELDFDYKIKRGVSQSFNATVLMAQMGIDIDPEDIKLHHE